MNIKGGDLDLTEGSSFLFDVTAVDDDDEIDNFNVWGWSFDGSSFGNMDNAGVVTLTGVPFVSQVATIDRLETSPTIDGDIADWNAYEAHALDFDANMAGTTAEDFSAYWKATWDDENVYMMAEITDDVLWNEGMPFWNHDAVNFFVGLNEKNGLGSSNDDLKELYAYWWGAGTDASFVGFEDAEGINIAKWDKEDGLGYFIEVSISLEQLNIKGGDLDLTEGSSFLFDVTAVDDDDEVDNFNVWGWSFDGSSFGNMDNAGVVTLENSVATNEVVEAEFKVYPNPTSDILTVDNFNNAESLFIYDLQGKILYSEKLGSNMTRTSINISRLQTGTYIILVKKAETTSVRRFTKI